jgi:hypothetical protein
LTKRFTVTAWSNGLLQSQHEYSAGCDLNEAVNRIRATHITPINEMSYYDIPLVRVGANTSK